MIYKRGRYFWVKFWWHGKSIYKPTRATDRRTARAIEGKIRSELAAGRFDILEAAPAPALAEFLKKDFLPYTESKFKDEPKTLSYYTCGSKMLATSDMASLPLNKITDQHARGFEARYSHLEASTINCGLRTLRRALSLAEE